MTSNVPAAVVPSAPPRMAWTQGDQAGPGRCSAYPASLKESDKGGRLSLVAGNLVIALQHAYWTFVQTRHRDPVRAGPAQSGWARRVSAGTVASVDEDRARLRRTAGQGS